MDSDSRAGRLASCISRHRWIPTVIWGIAIFLVSSVPQLAIKSEPFTGCDKVVHFIEYSVLGIALRYWSSRPRKMFLTGGVVFGGLDELHQRYIPGRVTSFWDFVADACGVLVGFYIGKIFIRKAAND